jgi:hypothetical protein
MTNWGTRLLIALGLGFVTYRLAIAVIPGKPEFPGDGPGLVDYGTSLFIGAIIGAVAWALLRPRHRSG